MGITKASAKNARNSNAKMNATTNASTVSRWPAMRNASARISAGSRPSCFEADALPEADSVPEDGAFLFFGFINDLQQRVTTESGTCPIPLWKIARLWHSSGFTRAAELRFHSLPKSRFLACHRQIAADNRLLSAENAAFASLLARKLFRLMLRVPASTARKHFVAAVVSRFHNAQKHQLL
ncbi:hypothetical protein RMSM_03642 [Rhodopirellula maiorica SM1]|uniref:Uncharacterized protein n=1 Tax=Rhodopirellula maiorica SM1 TaxID=1265738 RepID=M5RJE1_9BACT|nr:hypothetical protein RMSM_03642 [Rhodopirellula maiorica SM1]